MRWLRTRIEKEWGVKNERLHGREAHYVRVPGSRVQAGVVIIRDPTAGDAWLIFGTRRDGSDFSVLAPHLELLDDVKREAETYL